MVSDFRFFHLFASSPSSISDISVALCVNLDSPHRLEGFFTTTIAGILWRNRFLTYFSQLFSRREKKIQRNNHFHDLTTHKIPTNIEIMTIIFAPGNQKQKQSHCHQSMEKHHVPEASSHSYFVSMQELFTNFSNNSPGTIQISFWKIKYQEKEISECLEMMNCSAQKTLLKI